MGRKLQKNAIPETMTEAEFTELVIDAAHLFGWKCYHARPARTAKGWVTPVQGDGKGFIDLFCLHPGSGRQMVAELKIPPRECTDEQLQWLLWFGACRVPWFVWYPSHWRDGSIEKVLRVTL